MIDLRQARTAALTTFGAGGPIVTPFDGGRGRNCGFYGIFAEIF